jgi:hypothetical protein
MIQLMSKATLATFCAILIILTFATISQGVAIYTIIAEPVSSAANFPVDGFAEFEFTYATPDLDPSPNAKENCEAAGNTPCTGAPRDTYRSALILINLKDTGLTYDSNSRCYVGNGQVEGSFINYAAPFAMVRAAVAAETSLTITCRFTTPHIEQDKITTQVYIKEIPYTITDDDVQRAKPLSDIFTTMYPLGFDPTQSSQIDAEGDLVIPDIFTEADIFTFVYVFEPQGRKLLNDTEIQFIRETHFSNINQRLNIASVDSVLVIDHWATLKYIQGAEPVVTAINLRIYTRDTSSQFDFRLGLIRHVSEPLRLYSNPLIVTSLTYDINSTYRSNCYNGQTDTKYGETGVDCGNATCGHCAALDAACTADVQCSSNICLESGVCDNDRGQFIPSSAVTTTYAFAVAVVAVAMVLLL